MRKHLLDGTAESTLDFGARLGCGKWRHLVLQFCELVGDIGWQQIAARRQYLAELDENGAEGFERAAQAHGTRFGESPFGQHRLDESGDPAAGCGGEQELVQPETKGYGENANEAGETEQIAREIRRKAEIYQI